MNKITKANFKKLVLVLTLTLVMTLGMSISVFAATGAINGYAITGSSHITRTTASASTTYEKRTGSISVDSTYSYVNTYTLATGSSTKSKGYYTSVEINFSAPYNCHSVRIRSSHKVSAYGQTWSSNSTAVYWFYQYNLVILLKEKIVSNDLWKNWAKEKGSDEPWKL